MYIGELAKKTGLSIKAIRFYEEIGLLPEAQRKGRYRIYQQQDIEVLLLIKDAKQVGASLAQLRSLIPAGQSQLSWPQVGEFLSAQRSHVLQQMQVLQNQLEHIDTCLTQLTNCEKFTPSSF